MNQYRAVRHGLKNLSNWQKASQKDPNFVFEAKWILYSTLEKVLAEKIKDMVSIKDRLGNFNATKYIFAKTWNII